MKYIEGHTYYYIGARTSLDNVPIGLFDSYESALDYCKKNNVLRFNQSPESLIKKASELDVKRIFGIEKPIIIDLP